MPMEIGLALLALFILWLVIMVMSIVLSKLLLIVHPLFGGERPKIPDGASSIYYLAIAVGFCMAAVAMLGSIILLDLPKELSFLAIIVCIVVWLASHKALGELER